MKLLKDTSPQSLSCYLQCCKCLKMYRLCDMWADLEGIAFKDYYCDNCSVCYEDVKREIRGRNKEYFLDKYRSVKLARQIDTLRQNGI